MAEKNLGNFLLILYPKEFLANNVHNLQSLVFSEFLENIFFFTYSLFGNYLDLPFQNRKNSLLQVFIDDKNVVICLHT